MNILFNPNETSDSGTGKTEQRIHQQHRGGCNFAYSQAEPIITPISNGFRAKMSLKIKSPPPANI